MKWQPQHNSENRRAARLHLLVMFALLAGVLSAGAQTIHSSRAGNSNSPGSLMGALAGKHSGSAFGGVDGSVSAGLPDFVTAVGAGATSDYSGDLAASGRGGGRAPASPGVSRGNGTAAIALSRGIHSFSRTLIAQPGAGPQGPGEGGAMLPVLRPSQSSGSYDDEATSGDLAGTESGSENSEAIHSSNGMEQAGDPLSRPQGSGYESLCGQGCGFHAALGVDGGGATAENQGQAFAARLSGPASRLRESGILGGAGNGALFGRQSLSGSRLSARTSRHTLTSVYGGSIDRK
jgi:hypothetical protein